MLQGFLSQVLDYGLRVRISVTKEDADVWGDPLDAAKQLMSAADIASAQWCNQLGKNGCYLEVSLNKTADGYTRAMFNAGE